MGMESIGPQFPSMEEQILNKNQCKIFIMGLFTQ